jgi:hypothetical protein
MAMLTNNTSHIINVMGVMLVPGMPTEVPDEVMENEVIQDMMKEPVPDSDKMVLEAGDHVAEQRVQESDTSRSEHRETNDTRHAEQRQPAPPEANYPPAQGSASPPRTTGGTVGENRGGQQHPQQTTGGQQRPPPQQR